MRVRAKHNNRQPVVLDEEMSAKSGIMYACSQEENNVTKKIEQNDMQIETVGMKRWKLVTNSDLFGL